MQFKKCIVLVLVAPILFANGAIFAFGEDVLVSGFAYKIFKIYNFIKKTS